MQIKQIDELKFCLWYQGLCLWLCLPHAFHQSNWVIFDQIYKFDKHLCYSYCIIKIHNAIAINTILHICYLIPTFKT